MPLETLSKDKLNHCRKIMMRCKLRLQSLIHKCKNSKKKLLKNWFKSKCKPFSFWWILHAYKIMKRSYSCLNCWDTRYSWLRFSTEGLFMGGSPKISTHDVIIKAPRYPSSKWKMGTASAATPKFSGHLLRLLSLGVMVSPCCSTSLAKGTSQGNDQETI